MKKTATFLVSIFSIGISQAGTMGPVCTPDYVTVSCPCRGWDFGISALYLQPNTNSPLLNPILHETHSDTESSHTIRSSWDWGFLLEGSYHFNTGNDLNLNWMHFESNPSEHFAIFFPDAPAFPTTLYSDFKFDTKIDVVNLEFAQTTHFGKKTDVRLHGGGQYTNARIRRAEFESEQFPPDPTISLFQQSLIKTKYEGAGPRVGVDMTHHVKYGFNLFAQSAMSLLLGQGKAKLAGENISGPNVFTFDALRKKTYMVPELESRLGAGYQWAGGMGEFSIMAGWMWQHYLHIFSLPPGTTSIQGTNFTQSDLMLDGPFIKGKWISGC
ncbi:major outer membrane protein [Legionella wadsworthii]|uniref:Major outer membrane protein n=1 Tax=Legionella wadsworthii TaxID=28088 RepID=A0A378LLR0_9GAMM|nr:Lpg1974 family pore-forming outer membrane protein [Legionella wadsworthii]STY27955.1 major outer membrane protein [Legionella wadsworthii]